MREQCAREYQESHGSAWAGFPELEAMRRIVDDVSPEEARARVLFLELRGVVKRVRELGSRYRSARDAALHARMRAVVDGGVGTWNEKENRTEIDGGKMARIRLPDLPPLVMSGTTRWVSDWMDEVDALKTQSARARGQAEVAAQDGLTFLPPYDFDYPPFIGGDFPDGRKLVAMHVASRASTTWFATSEGLRLRVEKRMTNREAAVISLLAGNWPSSPASDQAARSSSVGKVINAEARAMGHAVVREVEALVRASALVGPELERAARERATQRGGD